MWIRRSTSRSEMYSSQTRQVEFSIVSKGTDYYSATSRFFSIDIASRTDLIFSKFFLLFSNHFLNLLSFFILSMLRDLQNADLWIFSISRPMWNRSSQKQRTHKTRWTVVYAIREGRHFNLSLRGKNTQSIVGEDGILWLCTVSTNV